MTTVFRILAMFFSLAILCQGAQRPNVVVILTAGIGRGEFSAEGHPLLKTPNLDRLRHDGADFRNMPVAPGATAAATELLSGLHEFLCGVTGSGNGRNFIRPDIPLMPEIFAKAGYQTSALGRWGLGEALPFRPEDRGFSQFLTIGGDRPGALADAWGNTQRNPSARAPSGWTACDGFSTAVWTGAAKRFIAGQAAARNPFFLLLAPTIPQPPLEAPDTAGNRFAKAGVAEPDATRFAMIEDLDARAGEIVGELERLNLAPSTLVVFVNGSSGPPSPSPPTAPGTCLMRLPGTIPENKTVTGLFTLVDLFQTIVGVSGLPVESASSGGRDFSSFLKNGGDPPPDRPYYTHIGNWSGNDNPARHQSSGFTVREGKWLLRGLELFDTSEDPGLSHNLFGEQPETATRLLAAYGRWWQEALPAMREPVRPLIGDPRQPVVLLNAGDWWPSRETETATAAPPANQGSLARFLEDLSAGRPLPETSGLWKLRTAREGNYAITLSLLPPTTPTADKQRPGKLKAGMVHLRTGREELRMAIYPNATAITLRADLPAGDTDIEAWFDGQLPGGKILGAFFASFERLGDRKHPEVNLDIHTIPKNSGQPPAPEGVPSARNHQPKP